jgi:DNA-binding NarL/FixJ family response regulator
MAKTRRHCASRGLAALRSCRSASKALGVQNRSGSRRSASRPPRLTERELQLAQLVADRKTNPEIAAELFLSQKTVETHLRNIFRKMGVASRVELARAVERADRADRATL